GLQGREERLTGASQPGNARHRGQNVMIRTAWVDGTRSRIGPVDVSRPGEVRSRRSYKTDRQYSVAREFALCAEVELLHLGITEVGRDSPQGIGGRRALRQVRRSGHDGHTRRRAERRHVIAGLRNVQDKVERRLPELANARPRVALWVIEDTVATANHSLRCGLPRKRDARANGLIVRHDVSRWAHAPLVRD